MKTYKKYLIESRFPPKAMDYNKVPNADDFWDWRITDVNKAGALRFNPKTIGDIIFWLNMAAQTWEMKQNK